MTTAIVTGGSMGIGLACTTLLADSFDHVFSFDVALPTEKNDKVTHIHCDMTNLDDISSAVKHVLDITGRVDALIANAGKHFSATIEETTFEDYDAIMNLDLKGNFFLLKLMLPTMREAASGSIVFIGSDQCFVGKPHSAVYGMTKGALANLTKSTALDYAPHNIRVNCICAGTIDTPLYRNAIERYSRNSGIPLAEVEKEEAILQPLNRVGKPEDIANLAEFLLSDKANFITGSLIPVDGGYTAR
jgi:2-keto-3-deoxy-L-fuconate dehydrogenase